MVGIWFPISAFVAIGFEHSVANMFLLPAGLPAGGMWRRRSLPTARRKPSSPAWRLSAHLSSTKQRLGRLDNAWKVVGRRARSK